MHEKNHTWMMFRTGGERMYGWNQFLIDKDRGRERERENVPLIV